MSPTTKKRGQPLELCRVAPGHEVILAAIEGGRTLQHRLAELGLSPGVRFKVLGHGGSGPFIICIKDSRLMLGKGMAGKVLVYPA